MKYHNKTKEQLQMELDLIRERSKYEQDKLQTLLDISTGLYEAKTFEDMGKTIISNLHKFKLSEVIGIRLAIYDKEKNEYTIVYQDESAYDASRKISFQMNKPVPLEQIKYYSKVAIDQKKTLVIQDNHSEYSLSIDYRQKDISPQSMIFIPLYYKDDLVGLFTLARSPQDSMDEDFINFLESIAKYLCIAIGELFNRLKQKRIEEELANERNLLQTIINIFPRDEIYVKDLKGRMIFFNKIFCEGKGKKPEELLGTTDFDFVPYEIASKYFEEEQEMLRTGKPIINKEVSFITRDGKFGCSLVNKTPLRDSTGNIIGLVGLNHGIAEVKRKFEELKTLQHISDGLYLSKTYEDIGRTVFNNLNEFRIGELIFGKLAVYDSDEDIYSVIYNIVIEKESLVEVPPIDGLSYPCSLKDVKRFSKIALEQKRTLIVQDNKSEYAKSVFYKDINFEYAMIFIPLLYKSKIVGLTSFARAPKNSMDDEFVAFLESISKYISIAIGELQNEIKNQKFQKEIVESEERYRTLVETSPDAIALFNKEGKYIICNQNAAKLHGFDNVNELIGKNSFDFVPPEHMENALRNGKKLFEEGSLRNVEYILTKKDGTRFYAETSLTLIYDTENKPEGFMGVLRDITERKKAEEELSQTKALLEAALEQTDAGIVVASAPDSRLKIVNSKTLEILGVEDETVLLNTPLLEIKQSWRDFRPDGSEIKMEEHPLALSLRGIKSENVEDRIVRKDGTERWILVNGTPILNKKGEIIAGFLIFTDITEHKLFEKSLEQEKERLAVTLRSIGDGVITTDTSGRIVLINKIAEELTGWKSEEAIGKLLNEVFHIINEISREERENPVDIILRTGNKIQLANHTSLISKNGTEKIIADSGSPIIDKEGKILGVVIVFRDITEKQKLEKEILKIQKLESIGILAGGIAHDFNNILTSIMGNLSIAKMTIDVSNKEKIIDLLTKTEKASLRAKDLTQQLLTFAKGGSPILKSGSMEDVLRDSINFALRGSNIKSEITIENLWTVEMDEGQVSQVIQNLIINADQAMPQGGTIKVKAENILIDDTHKSIPLDKGKYIKVSIEDQGIGIPADYLSKIFDPYFTTKPKGSGLGLASSYSIINKHGGVITAESKLGKGSKFTFYLPASEKKVEQEEPVSETIKTGEGNILILDDEESIREMLMEILTSLGYTADSVADGLEAVELYKKALNSNNPYDLVIADLTVPGGMGGKETLSELLKIDPNAKVIVSSGYSTDPIMSEYWKYGFKGIITKPYGMEEVSKVLHGIVNK